MDLAKMYSNPANLESRRVIHTKYSSGPSLLDETIRLARLSGAEDVLDVGCGQGLVLQSLADKGHKGRLVGADPYKGMFQATNPKIEFLVSKAEGLPFRGAEFDRVIANHMLYHTEVQKALAEIRRVLKPGGLLLASTNSKDSKPFYRGKCMAEVGARLGIKVPDVIGQFTLENGEAQLRAFFSEVSLHKIEFTITYPSIKPFLDSVSGRRHFWDVTDEQWGKILGICREMAEKEIAGKGKLQDVARTGIFVAK